MCSLKLNATRQDYRAYKHLPQTLRRDTLGLKVPAFDGHVNDHKPNGTGLNSHVWASRPNDRLQRPCGGSCTHDRPRQSPYAYENPRYGHEEAVMPTSLGLSDFFKGAYDYSPGPRTSEIFGPKEPDITAELWLKH